MSTPHFLVHSPKDNVGVVVVEGLTAGTDMLGVVTETDIAVHADRARTTFRSAIRSRSSRLTSGDTAIKYGEDIGQMVADAAPGEHVHVHNLKTKRW